jgi:hypothetical protein
MKRMTTALIAMALLVAAPLAADDSTRWLNVHVTEHEDGANIEVHLPLSLVLSVIRSVNVENFNAGKVDIELDEDVDIDWPEVFRAIKDAPDGDFVKVDAEDATVVVTKAGGTITVDVDAVDDDEQAKVNVTLPASFIDAIQVDEDNRIDVAAILESFSDFPDGDLVTVTSPDADVRVWVE